MSLFCFLLKHPLIRWGALNTESSSKPGMRCPMGLLSALQSTGQSIQRLSASASSAPLSKMRRLRTWTWRLSSFRQEVHTWWLGNSRRSLTFPVFVRLALIRVWLQLVVCMLVFEDCYHLSHFSEFCLADGTCVCLLAKDLAVSSHLAPLSK